MKKNLIALIVAGTAAIHTQSADPASQLQGYWQIDIEKSFALAKKANREIDPLVQAMMGKMVFEFQKDTMIVRGPLGGVFGGVSPLYFTLGGVSPEWH